MVCRPRTYQLPPHSDAVGKREKAQPHTSGYKENGVLGEFQVKTKRGRERGGKGGGIRDFTVYH